MAGKSKRKTWRCFHCDEVFRSRKSAYAHFGPDDREEKYPPVCIDPLRTDEKARMNELREAQQYALQCQDDANAAVDESDMAVCELEEFKRITNCQNASELRMWLDSQQGRVVTANALIDGFRKEAPELADKIIG